MKRALLIGINYLGTDMGLEGCINDVYNMKGLLGAYGYADFRIITDMSAIKPTAQNIIDGMNWLTAGLRLGDTVVMYYSGHGVQVADRNGDEIDGKDEALVSSDRFAITDDIIRRLLVDRIPFGARCIAFFDCCHSGSVCDLKHNFIAPGGIALRYFMDKSSDARGNVFTFAACRDSEEAAEMSINGQKQGVFTRALVDALASKKPVTSRQLLRAISATFAKNGYNQFCQSACSQALLLDSPLRL